MTDPNRLIEPVCALSREAGAAIMRHFGGAAAAAKSDGSPVTAADREADAVILAGLRELTPDLPIVTEEEVAEGRVPDISGGAFWLVDPLDGTRDFLKGTDEFTVNIALMRDFQPVMGVVYAPARRELYAGIVGAGAFFEGPDDIRRDIRARTPEAQGLVAVCSRSHGRGEAYESHMARLNVRERLHVGSSLKLCMIAAGKADVYLRYGEISEWDTAAGDAVLRAAGGRIETLEGATLGYGKPNFAHPHFKAQGL